MRLMIQICGILIGLNLLTIVMVIDRQYPDSPTLNLYLVSTGRDFNQVYYVDHEGVFRRPFLMEERVNTSPELQFVQITSTLLVRDNEKGTSTRVTFMMNQSPRGVEYLATLPRDQRMSAATQVQKPLSSEREKLIGLAMGMIGAGMVAGRLRQKVS